MRMDAPLHCKGQLVASRDGLHDDVAVFHAGLFKGLASAGHERVYDFAVPAGVDDADSELRACVQVPSSQQWTASFTNSETCLHRFLAALRPEGPF